MNIKRLIFFICSIFLIFLNHASDARGCTDCHSNPQKMLSLGYPHLTVTSHEITAQTRMLATCTDCHLGNPESTDKELAHEGLLTVMAIKDRTWEAVRRAMTKSTDLSSWQTLEPRGLNRADALLPKIISGGNIRNNPDYKLIIWHDRNVETLAFNPLIAEKTCGKCHGDIVKKFLQSPMGGGRKAHTQSQYKAWTGPAGPQSCGLWVGKLAEPDQATFTKENVGHYNQHAAMHLTEKTAYDNQRRCNQCHVGCLDCHYSPAKRDEKNPQIGPHDFTKRPDPVACYGGGKSFSCHAGPLERRRGDGYIRTEFTQASEDGIRKLKDSPDIHMKNGVLCIDCHEPNKENGFHADLRRDADCSKCHLSVVKAHAKGPHKKVDCASCHTTLIGGYAFNFWSAVGPKGNENPLTRIQDYLVGAVSPLLIKNPKGIWIPVHVVPHISGNVKADEVVLSKGLIFRNSPDAAIDRLYFSNDSYAVTGFVVNLDNKDHDTMVWMNIDRVAHAAGKSRNCGSCHGSTSQRIVIPYSDGSYKDVGDGEYVLAADEKGLRVEFHDSKYAPLPEGLRLLRDKWALSGNFALPGLKNKKYYDKLEDAYKKGFFTH
jgi:hypothetical protein